MRVLLAILVLAVASPLLAADDIQNGRLICEIGVAIVRPAEFVIFRIEQITGFANQ